jgi:transcriptional regulator with XRE-family HTH domain
VDLSRELAESLRRSRSKVGLTQTQMAKRLGISQATLDRLESGSQNTTLKTLGQLCGTLKCSVIRLPSKLPGSAPHCSFERRFSARRAERFERDGC